MIKKMYYETTCIFNHMFYYIRNTEVGNAQNLLEIIDKP